jgi:hypothetical protein
MILLKSCLDKSREYLDTPLSAHEMGFVSTQSGPRKVVQLVGNSGFHQALSDLGSIATLHEQIINLQRRFISGTILQTENQKLKNSSNETAVS